MAGHRSVGGKKRASCLTPSLGVGHRAPGVRKYGLQDIACRPTPVAFTMA